MNNWHLENRLNVEKLFQLQRQFSLTDLSFSFFFVIYWIKNYFFITFLRGGFYFIYLGFTVNVAG